MRLEIPLKSRVDPLGRVCVPSCRHAATISCITWFVFLCFLMDNINMYLKKISYSYYLLDY